LWLKSLKIILQGLVKIEEYIKKIW
jgi:hypothetical protein